MILSIDVGIRNLAMCMLDETSNLIVQWDVSGVPPEHKDGLFVSMRNHLDDKPWVLKADTVLIEKQPDKNRKMKIVEHFLHAYFIIRNPKAETIIYDARFKIPDFAGPGKVMYNKRKKASIERCQQFIWNNTVNAHWIPIFNASKKKDDLADTVMQSVYKKSKKLVLRKPYENQKRSRYSKSILAYIYKNKKVDEDLEKNKRFMKDLKRYYKSIGDLVKELQ